jgi:hypothetical protein
VLGISGPDPSFSADDGCADPDVATALQEFAGGLASEHAALTALAASRLLVPVVPVLADSGLADSGLADSGLAAAADGPANATPVTPGPLRAAGRGERATELAMPTLVGLDGRRAVPAFTSLATMRQWQPAARPVPVAAQRVWQAAAEESAAVVIDVAGPVPFAVEGARLAALARGEAAPPPWEDPDVREIVADALSDHLEIASFELRPPGPEQDLAIALTGAGREAGRDAARLAGSVGEQIMARLGGRLRRGVQIWLGLHLARGW